MSHKKRRMKFDRKDRAVLDQLQQNARMPMTLIARKTRLPLDVVKYRIKRLEREGVIKQYLAYIDHAKIGKPLLAYVAFTQYNLNPEMEIKFRQHLVAHPQITYVAKYSGKWDYTIAICAKDYRELDEVIHEIRTRFSDIIKDYEVTPVIEEYKLFRFADLIASGERKEKEKEEKY
jgi:Lrp/AsnC family transcriptional regulator, leucine-responsive regulatory protein